MAKEMSNRRGQVAVFVIIALVVVGSIVIFFLIRRNIVGFGGEVSDPEQYFRQCIEPSTNEAVDKILPQGGFLDPGSFKMYNDAKITYLCKTDGFYVPCINIHPMLISEISQEIKSYISPSIEGCFESLKKEFEKKQMGVEVGETNNFSVFLAPGKVIVEVAKDMKVTEKGTIRTFEKFNSEIRSPIYNLASVAINIADNERKYCNFEYVGYMGIDRSVDIKKLTMSDSTKIYTIKDIDSGKIMNIAIRGCALPAGI